MSDISEYSFEYRILAACWYHECDKGVSAIRALKAKLREKFSGEPPDTRYIAKWEDKLFTTGSILDQARCGRPNERGDHHKDIEQSVEHNPRLSVRLRSQMLEIPQTSLYRSMTDDLGYRNWKPTKVQFLSEADHQSRVER